ncbi:MAG: hypothetical protein Q7I89_08035 [Syntrophales bacterium]|nr:hypothetical protein [Syntrophales bacterium]
MKRKMIIILLFLIFSQGISWAAVSTEDLAARARQGQELFDELLRERNRNLEQIMENTSKSPRAKELDIRKLQEEFLKQSREMHLKYREPFIQRVIAETNQTLPAGKKIKPGKGSGIYQRHKVTGRILQDEKGRKIVNPQHRGMQGDLDLGGDPRAVKRLEETFEQYKHIYLPEGSGTGAGSRSAVTSKMKDAPGYRDFGDVEVTINIAGEPDLPGGSAHQTTVRMDAFSKETYVSFGMDKKQAGRNLVETNDNIKKAIKGFSSPPAGLLGAKGEKPLQGMSKGTLKSIESGTVGDAQLAKALQESGYKGNVAAFKEQLELIKEGHLHQGVGLNADNIEAFQKACKKTTDQALENAHQQFARQKTEVQAQIETYDAKIKSGELSGDQLEQYKKNSQRLRNELVDSKVKIEETSLANKVKLEGGSYDDYFQKNALTNVTPITAAPKMTRTQAIKSGLTPGLLDIAGYGRSAYNVYDNITRMQKGEISQNDAVIGITTEVIDTGFGMVTDVGTAAAIGSIGTGTAGAAASIGVPFVVVYGAGYAVSTAVEEGLRTFEELKVEEISEKIAKSKKEQVINTLQLQTDQMLKAGEATGDWRYFAKADDIANSLERMYQVTGDDDFRKTFDDIYNRVTQKKESLEAKYNCSIYALKGKMEAAKAPAGEAVKELKIRAAHALMGDQYGNYSITVPEGFKEPFTVRIAGGGLEVSKSSNPLRGQFRGIASTSDSTHTLSFLVKDVNGLTARGTVTVKVRGLDPKTMAGRNKPKPTLYAAPPRLAPAVPSGEESGEGDDYNEKLKGIRDNYNQEMIRIQQQKNKAPAYKPQPRPATPSWGAQGNQSQQKQCRSFQINMNSCLNALYSCQGRCPKTGNRSSCFDQCNLAVIACKRGQCPGGSLAGMGSDVKCTICQ